MMMIRHATLFSLVLLLGCGGAGRPEGDLPELQQARGKVTRAGQPVADGFVQFCAASPDAGDDDLIVTSVVGMEGEFELATTHALSQRKASGAPAGEYKVTYLPPGESQDVPPITLPNSVTIAAGPNELTIELESR